MNPHRIRLIAGRILFHYLCVLFTYSVVRIPIGVLALAFAAGRHPDTIAWAMRYPDCVVYLPFRLLLDGLQGIENTRIYAYVVIGYLSTLALVSLGLGIVATFKAVRRFLEVMGG